MAQITFGLDGTAALKLRGPEAKTLILSVAQEEKWQIYASNGRPLEIPELSFKIPVVWAQNVVPVMVELKPGVTPLSQKQYFIPQKTQVRIQKHFDRLLKYGIL
jgi:hypothetical protein